MPMRSAPRSSEGPAVVTMDAPISLAMMVASVVLPSPGGPESRTWSSGSRCWRAASTETRRLSTAARCPTYSSRRWGRSWRSTCVSSGRATRLITRASSFMAFALPSGATIDLVEQLFGSAHSGPAAERGRDELGGLARSMTELLDHHLEDHCAQPFVIARRGYGGRALLLHVGSRLDERELSHLALELRHDVLGLLGPDAGQAAQVSFVLPRDGGRDVADGRRERAGRHQRPHVLHRDELLEELLVQLRREPNQDGAGLVLRCVIVDGEQHLVGAVALSRLGVGEGGLGHGRNEHLVPDASRLDHDTILELPAESAADRGDHRVTCRRTLRPAGSRPVSRAM